MESRTFLAGAAVGLVAGVLATNAFRPERFTPDEGDDAPAGTPGEARPNAGVPHVNAPPAPAGISATLPHRTGPDGSPSTTGHQPAATAYDALPDPDADFLEKFADRWEEAPSAAELSRRLKSESRDDSWASYMETQLRDYLARRPVPNSLGTTSVRCAATVCRLVSAVNVQIWTGIPNADLQAAMNELPNESLGRELTFVMSSFGEHPQDSTMMVIVVFLKRAETPRENAP
jgi:hypothetical protein